MSSFFFIFLIFILLISAEPMILKIIKAFSAYTNAKKIFSLDSNENDLECLHGVRFLAFSWIVLGHTYIYRLAVTGMQLNFIIKYNNRDVCFFFNFN